VLSLAHPATWRALSALLVAAIVAASLTPGSIGPDVGNLDKLGHFAGYSVLALWFGGLYPRARYLVLGIVLIALGLLLEVLQQGMGLGRTGDPRDALANLAGVATGLLASLAGLGGWAPRIERWLARR
jgi:VanZ family protein